MKTFTLVNLMLNMTCTIEAEDRRTAQGYAMDLADSDSSDNDHAYWIMRRDYHDVEGFKDVSLSNKTYTMVNNELNVYCTVEAQHTAAAINKATQLLWEDRQWIDRDNWTAEAGGQDFHGLKNITPMLCIDAATANEIIEGI